MIRSLTILGVLMICAAPASAQHVAFEVDCSLLPGHEGGAEYTPGVDVHGNPVVPADLNSNIKSLEYPIEIPVKFDIVSDLNIDAQEELNLDPKVATLMLFEDGHIEYNGQDISDRANIVCKNGETAAKDTDGHKADDSLPSEAGAKPQPPAEKPEDEVLEGEAN